MQGDRGCEGMALCSTPAQCSGAAGQPASGPWRLLTWLEPALSTTAEHHPHPQEHAPRLWSMQEPAPELGPLGQQWVGAPQGMAWLEDPAPGEV